jgi:ketosteroid isomerase-like protein
MSRLMYLMLASLLGVQVLAAQQSPAKSDVAAELKDLDRQWQDAIVLGDSAFIRERTSDDFVFTHGGGATQTKADWIRIAQRVPRRFLERRTSNQSIELHGDVAIVFGRLDVRVAGSDSVQSCYALQYAHLYTFQGGKWKFASHRTTQSLEDQHPCVSA